MKVRIQPAEWQYNLEIARVEHLSAAPDHSDRGRKRMKEYQLFILTLEARSKSNTR